MSRLWWTALALACAAPALGGGPAEPGARGDLHRAAEAVARLKLPDVAERVRALETIERFPDKALPYLVRAARNDDALLRARVAHALGRIGKGRRDALFALGELLEDPNVLVRREAILAAAAAGDPSHVPLVEPLLKDAVPAARADAVRALAALDPAHAEARMKQLLAHEDAAVRRAALAETAAALERARGQLRAEKDAQRRADLAKAADAQAAQLAQAARSLLGDADAGVRLDATSALARSGKATAATFVGLLGDKDALVRAAAVSGLRRVKAADAVPRLIGLLEDPSQGVRAAAISALGELDAARASVRPLVNQLGGSAKRCRERAILALGFLGRKRGKSDVRHKLAWRAAPALIQLLADEDADIRQKAHLALRFMFGENVVFNARGSVADRERAMAEWQAVWEKKRGAR